MRVALDLTKGIRADKGTILDRRVTILGDVAAILGCGATFQAILWLRATIQAVLGGAATILRGAATILEGAATILGGAAVILAGGGIETYFRSGGEHVTMV